MRAHVSRGALLLILGAALIGCNYSPDASPSKDAPAAAKEAAPGEYVLTVEGMV
jgi:hypothetical protein